MIAEMNGARVRYVASPPPSTNCQPRPGPLTPPWADAMRGLMMLSVNALTRLLNAKATTSPTATTITSPRIRKFLKPVSMAIPPHRWICRHDTRTTMLSLPFPTLEPIRCHGRISNRGLNVAVLVTRNSLPVDYAGGKRWVRSLPDGKPSCLISWSQSPPEGNAVALVGRQGAMNPAGRRRTDMAGREGKGGGERGGLLWGMCSFI